MKDESWDIVAMALEWMANLATLALGCRVPMIAHVGNALSRRRRDGWRGWPRLWKLEVQGWSEASVEFPDALATMQTARFVSFAGPTVRSLSVRVFGHLVVHHLRLPRFAPMPLLRGWQVSEPPWLQTAIYEAAPGIDFFILGHMGWPSALSAAATMKTRSALVSEGVTVAAGELQRLGGLETLRLYGQCADIANLPATITRFQLVVRSFAQALPTLLDPTQLPGLLHLDICALDPTMPPDTHKAQLTGLIALIFLMRPRIEIRVVRSVQTLAHLCASEADLIELTQPAVEHPQAAAPAV